MTEQFNEDDLMDHHAIGAVIRDSMGNILIQKHVKYGFWTIPIGKFKKNQNSTECLKEELYEECNIKVLEYRKLT